MSALRYSEFHHSNIKDKESQNRHYFISNIIHFTANTIMQMFFIFLKQTKKSRKKYIKKKISKLISVITKFTKAP